MKKYSLWLRPEGKIRNQLQSLINQLTDKYGGPKFEPHVTLLGDINSTDEDSFLKTFQLSNLIKPYEINLGKLGFTDYYFRCVFILAKKTKLVMDINLLARKIFGKENDDEYMPHLSLLYGDLDEELKKKIIAELGFNINYKLKIKSIYLTNSSSSTNIKDWRVLAEFPMSMVETLKRHGVGVIPTDTIYGIVGSALNPDTVEKIHKLRKRSINKPMIILISGFNDLNQWNIRLTDKMRRFLKRIWPNPVTVVLPVNGEKWKYLHRGANSLAFRMPKDPWLRKFLEQVGPLVVPSANFEGEKVAEDIDDAKKYFGDEVDFYMDSGKIKSAPSTLVKLEKDGSYKILRQGSYKIS